MQTEYNVLSRRVLLGGIPLQGPDGRVDSTGSLDLHLFLSSLKHPTITLVNYCKLLPFTCAFCAQAPAALIPEASNFFPQNRNLHQWLKSTLTINAAYNEHIWTDPEPDTLPYFWWWPAHRTGPVPGMLFLMVTSPLNRPSARYPTLSLMATSPLNRPSVWYPTLFLMVTSPLNRPSARCPTLFPMVTSPLNRPSARYPTLFVMVTSPLNRPSARYPTLFLMVTRPLNRPSARYCPSFVQLHAVTLLFTLCFETDFCSGDHNPVKVQ